MTGKQNSKGFILVFLGMLSAFGPFVMDMYLPTLPAMSDFFQTTSSKVQLGLTTSMVGLAIGQLVFGPLSDKYGRRSPLLVAMGLFLISTVGCIFSRDISQFVLWRFVQGVAGAGGVVISRSIAADKYSAHELAGMLATIGAVNGIATVVAPIGGGALADFGGWHGIFWFLFALGVLLVIGSVRFKESLPIGQRQNIRCVDMYHRFGAFQVNFLVEGFYTRLSDVFVLENIGERDGILIKERRNGSGAKVLGLSMEGKMAYLSLFQLQAGVTLQQSRYDEPEKWSETAPAEKKIFRTPNTYGYFTATYMPIKPLSLSLSGTYTGSMLVQHMAGYIDKDVAVNTRDFFDMGVKVAYDFKLYKSVDLQLSAGVQNVFNAYQNDFDQGVERDSGYIYGPAAPRSYFAGIKISY